MKITGKDLIALGYEQGQFNGRAKDTVNVLGLKGPALAAWDERNKPNPREARG